MIGNKIPDFRIVPWRENGTFRLVAEDKSLIGRYIEYINERTGDFGVRIEIGGVRDPVLAWEESFVFGGKEIGCRYVAYRENDVWKKIRVKNYYPDRAVCEVSGRITKITLYFGLVIKGEKEISYSISF